MIIFAEIFQCFPKHQNFLLQNGVWLDYWFGARLSVGLDDSFRDFCIFRIRISTHREQATTGTTFDLVVLELSGSCKFSLEIFTSCLEIK